MYEVLVTEPVRDRDLPSLGNAHRARALAKMQTLAIHPNRHPPLRGRLTGYRSVRAGQMRIIFTVDDERGTVTIVAVGRRHARERRDVYAETERRLEQSEPGTASAPWGQE